MSTVEANDAPSTTEQTTPKPKTGKKAKPASPKTSTKQQTKAGNKSERTSKKSAAKKGATRKEAKPADARDGSKKAIILELLRRKEGATLAEMTEATGWQKHSVHGFLSGQLRKKMGIRIESEKNAEGVSAYRITA